MNLRTPFFTSDTHFFHENIIRLCDRPFSRVEEMEEAIISRWNAKISKSDLVYHLGDFALKCTPEQARGVVKRLNGQIILIRGNHEKVADQIKDAFAAVKDYDEISIPDLDAPNGKRKVVLLHYAMRVWNGSHHGSYHLYGHSHGSLPDDPNALAFDVGVDCWDFAPLSYEEVKTVMSGKTWKPVDHHGG
ncbi:MAG: metallophosphoesterase family protein [Cytophagales bacterium]|nr:metallophosphoesterase family protein [Armatimonadota bacterium]